VTEPERVVAGLGKHPTFIRSENAAVIIVDERAKAGASRAAEVYVTDGTIRKHSGKKERSIKLPKQGALPINLENSAQSTLIEAQPVLRIILRELLRLDGKTKRGQRPQEIPL
jgi:hypothetical protein